MFGGDAGALPIAERDLDGVEADLALARGRVLHARFLDERQHEDLRELALFERAADLNRRLDDVRGEGEALFWIGTFHQVVRGTKEPPMGATVIAYWPGITEEQIEEQPGFYNDYKAWGDWMAEREGEPAVLHAIRELGAGPILTSTSAGIAEDEVYWVTPRELQAAARQLRAAVKEGRPGVAQILDVYARSANGVAPIAEEFMQDLLDIAALARWAEERQATKMTLEVNW